MFLPDITLALAL